MLKNKVTPIWSAVKEYSQLIWWIFASAGLGIFVGQVLSFSLGLPVGSANAVGLNLNIASEFVGIAVTVFWVDRLLRRREESRWEPAKHLLYSELMDLTGDLYAFALPRELRKRSVTVYVF